MNRPRTVLCASLSALALATATLGAQFLPGQENPAAPTSGDTNALPGDFVRPAPEVRDPGKPPLLWNYGLAGLLVALAVGVNCIPSKRGHQD
ncbi:MAG: hypothetical protein KIT24_06170 [Phycisphaeraceae bacterium]|nr:hypothetical protein [Phycisphaeraceae bacterium]